MRRYRPIDQAALRPRTAWDCADHTAKNPERELKAMEQQRNRPHTLHRPCCLIYPRHPYLPKGPKGGRDRCSTSIGQLTTQRPGIERVRHRVHRAKRLGTAGCRARSKRPLDAPTPPRWCKPLRGNIRLPPLAGPSPPLLPDLPSPSLSAQGGEGARERCSTIVWVAGFSVSQEDQFQRNGVILDQRSGVWNDDTGAVSRGGAGRLYWHL
jgi:hypothetical protein